MKIFFKILTWLTVLFVLLIIVIPAILIFSYISDNKNLNLFNSTSLNITAPVCQVLSAEQNMYRLDLEQTANAALIAAISVQQNLPPRAASIAIATALQESSLRNINYGDLDSLGLFQQRPSQGWGSPKQIMDPFYSTKKFYDTLIKIPNYATEDINDVAQKVQRSGHPYEYRKHETLARNFASAFTGHSEAGVNCKLTPTKNLADEETIVNNFTVQANNVVSEIKQFFYPQKIVPANNPNTLVVTPSGPTAAWAIANWAVGVAYVYHIEEVSYQNYVWVRNIDASWEQVSTENFSSDVTIKTTNGI